MDLSPYLDLFVSEAREHIAAAAELASVMDDAAEGKERLRELFRHVHSVKGMAASMGFEAMTALAHDAESLMEELRQGRITPHRPTRNVLCDALSCLERMVDRVAARETVDDETRAELQGKLRSAMGEPARSNPAAPEHDPGGSAGPAGASAETSPAGCVKLSLIIARDRPFPSVRAAVVLGQLRKLGRLAGVDPPMAALRSGRFDGRLQATLVTELNARSLARKIASYEDVESFTLVPAERLPEKAEPPTAKPSLRIRTDRLDAVIDYVLELMSLVGRIGTGVGEQGTAVANDAESARLLARRAYDELVEMRLVPFEVAAHRLRRVADELSRRLGKLVAVEVCGENVRMDRSLLEKLLDPLLHMVRNAVDHGVEGDEERRKRRKAPTGRVTIRVARHASRLSIVVEDDGRGLDVRRLKEIAIERGLLTPSQAVRLADRDALFLITVPGFSTLEETTEVSGRGVGMDVVKNAVEAVGGRLRIDTRLGHGTRFELTLPPTVALVQTYLVRAAGMTFAVPVASLKKMAAINDGSTIWRDGRRFCSSDSDEIPVFALREVLGLDDAPTGADGMALIGESAREGLIGVEVDQVIRQAEIVVRPLPAPLSEIVSYSGAAVLDDGSIVLVLDPANLP